jgi:hypothetical protein
MAMKSTGSLGITDVPQTGGVLQRSEGEGGGIMRHIDDGGCIPKS